LSYENAVFNKNRRVGLALCGFVVFILTNKSHTEVKLSSHPSWKIRELIAALGGVANLTDKFVAVGVAPPSKGTMAGWYRRDSAPGGWVLCLLLVAEAEGILPEIGRLRREEV
jgi:hypothetical protein